MKKRPLVLICFFCLSFCYLTLPLSAADMRAGESEVQLKRTQLLEQTRTEKSEAEAEALQTSRQIHLDQQALTLAIEKLERENRLIQASNRKQRIELKRLEDLKQKLQKQQKQIDTVARELIGFIRINARDLDALISRSLQSAFIKERGGFLTRFLNSDIYPDMEAIQKMVGLLLEEIRLSGEVRFQDQTIVGRSGEAETASVLILGNFTAAYQTAAETGFALYSEKSRRLFALSKLPSAGVQKDILQYMNGETADIPMDISRGSALRQITGNLDLFEQITSGGPVVWPILGILLFGILIVAERLIFLLRRHVNAEKLSEQLNTLAMSNRWEACGTLLDKVRHKPLSIVLRVALNNRKQKREDIENALQEIILGQIPPLERFLSTLGMLASIAPLLGLLGTVTGMINTFHTITYFGTGDAKMMSGGISEALVTTMLGLSVAIPIMFSHTLLSRFVENLIAQMEEKAVAFINTIERMKEENDPAV